jgi:hypothetical protein
MLITICPPTAVISRLQIRVKGVLLERLGRLRHWKTQKWELDTGPSIIPPDGPQQNKPLKIRPTFLPAAIASIVEKVQAMYYTIDLILKMFAHSIFV